jgi:hypothetical protein
VGTGKAARCSCPGNGTRTRPAPQGDKEQNRELPCKKRDFVRIYGQLVAQNSYQAAAVHDFGSLE